MMLWTTAMSTCAGQRLWTRCDEHAKETEERGDGESGRAWRGPSVSHNEQEIQRAGAEQSMTMYGGRERDE